MTVHIDRPDTWKLFRSVQQCQECFAGCCTLPVEVSASDLLRLELTTEDELGRSAKRVYSRLKREGFIRSYFASKGIFILEQKGNRDCVFLDSNSRRCTVYERRPEVCRQFPKIGPRPGFCPERPKK
jgi:Fe-S-cluster containining protein